MNDDFNVDFNLELIRQIKPPHTSFKSFHIQAQKALTRHSWIRNKSLFQVSFLNKHLWIKTLQRENRPASTSSNYLLEWRHTAGFSDRPGRRAAHERYAVMSHLLWATFTCSTLWVIEYILSKHYSRPSYTSWVVDSWANALYNQLQATWRISTAPLDSSLHCTSVSIFKFLTSSAVTSVKVRQQGESEMNIGDILVCNSLS